MAYTGITRGAKFSAKNMEAALDSKVTNKVFDENTQKYVEMGADTKEIITGKKIFKESPVVPEKPQAEAEIKTADNNPTAIATEAQVYNTFSNKANVNNVLNLEGDQNNVGGEKTFDTSPVVPGKNGAVDYSDDAKKAIANTAIATEAQVYEVTKLSGDKANASEVVMRDDSQDINGKQEIAGKKIFSSTPEISEYYKAMPTDNAGSTIAATEGQACKIAYWVTPY
jgi:hypothetical protein